jgi:hypothetical protein
MQPAICQEVRSFLQEAIQSKNPAPPLPPLIPHIAGCMLCRGALALLTAAVIDRLTPPGPTTCAVCQEHLAAYIDQEADAGIHAALQAYPQVWWHLWVCRACAETYQFTRTLLDTERVGILEPLPTPHPALRAQSQRLPIIRLTRAFLALAFCTQPSRARGVVEADDSNMVLFDTESSGHRVQMWVVQPTDRAWSITVATTPPIAARFTIALGELHFRARFDAHGVAIISDIPAAALQSTEGPDLVGIIERDEGD